MIVPKNNFFQLFVKIFCPFIPCTQSQSDWGENKITQQAAFGEVVFCARLEKTSDFTKLLGQHNKLKL